MIHAMSKHGPPPDDRAHRPELDRSEQPGNERGHAERDDPDATAHDPEPWDAGDERRQKDCFAPPAEPCECYCLHCGRTFMSDGIWFQKVVGDPQGFSGFWMCPTPNCDGAGFTFDIFPTDPAHPANEGWSYDGDYDEDADGEEGEWEPEFEDDADPDAEYDPAEPQYKAMEEMAGPDDLEGEEWKYGLAPGERPDRPMSDAQAEWLDEQKKYDAPDERPRVIDWSNRPDRNPGPDGNSGGGPGPTGGAGGPFKDDDIPF